MLHDYPDKEDIASRITFADAGGAFEGRIVDSPSAGTVRQRFRRRRVSQRRQTKVHQFASAGRRYENVG